MSEADWRHSRPLPPFVSRWGRVVTAFLLWFAMPAAAAAQRPARDSTTKDSLPRAVLDPVTVTVTRTEAALAALPYSISSIDQRELRRGRATDGLDEALAIIPGVVVANRYNYALDQRIAVRGFGARSAFGVRGVKILLDGIPQTLPDGQGQLTNLELGDVERIEIWRGASSSLYGNASGGVISVTTGSQRPANLQSTVRLTAGAHKFRKGLVSVAAPMGAGSARAVASWTTTDGHREHSSADLRRFSFRVAQPVSPRTRLTVVGHVAHRPEALNPGALTQTEMDTLPIQAAPRNVATGAREMVTQVQGGMALRHELPQGGAVDVAVFGLRRDLEEPLPFATIDLDRWTYGVRASTTLPLSGLPTVPVVTLGVDAQWQRDDRLNRSLDGTQTTLDQFERVAEIGPFVRGVVALGSRLFLTAGARYDRVSLVVDDRLLSNGDQSGDRVLDAVSASGGITAGLTPAFVPYASVSTTFETPTTTELVNRPEGGGGLNLDLAPQRAVQYEVGFRGRPPDGRLRYSVAAFQVDVRDALIPFESVTEPGRQYFRNAGSARRRGLEAFAEVRLPAGVAAIVAYTYADYRFEEFRTTDDTFDGNEIPGIPRHRLHWSVRADGFGGVWAAVDNTYTSSFYVDDANTTEAAEWLVASVRVGWEGGVRNWRIAPFVSVLNVFDQRYAGSVVVNARGGRFFEPAPGRSLVVGVEIGN